SSRSRTRPGRGFFRGTGRVCRPFGLEKRGFQKRGEAYQRGDERRNPASASRGTGGRHPRSVGPVATPEGGQDPRSPLSLRTPLAGRVALRRGGVGLARLPRLPGGPPPLPPSTLGRSQPAHPAGLSGQSRPPARLPG